MIAAIAEVLPEEASKLDMAGTTIEQLKKYVYAHNYQVRGKYDRTLHTNTVRPKA